jgi:predicted ATP-dependent Lon-type protease
MIIGTSSTGKPRMCLKKQRTRAWKKSFLDEFQRFFTLAEAFKGDAVVRGVKRTKHKLMMEDETLDHKEGLDLAIEIRRRKILENFEDDEEDASMDSE